MREPTITDVMSRVVATVAPDAPFREVVTTLNDTGVSALPVLDRLGQSIGVVADIDVLAELEFHYGAS